MSKNDELKGKVEEGNEDGRELGLVPGGGEERSGSGLGLGQDGRLGSGDGGSGDADRSGDAGGSEDDKGSQEEGVGEKKDIGLGETKSMGVSRNRDEVGGKAKSKVKFDKEKHPLEKSGHWFRKDHLKLYKIHAALKGCSRQELINKALEYYKVNVLQKSEAQKLKEAGQEELGI